MSLVAIGVTGLALAQSAAAADLFLCSLEVERAKAGGDSWDPFNGKPEPCVVIQSENDRSISPHGSNTFYMSFSHRALRNVQAGDEISIVVWDLDTKDNDLIGATTLKITHRMIEQGRVELSFDQVECLRIELE